jgi:hypothetical protein
MYSKIFEQIAIQKGAMKKQVRRLTRRYGNAPPSSLQLWLAGWRRVSEKCGRSVRRGGNVAPATRGRSRGIAGHKVGYVFD